MKTRTMIEGMIDYMSKIELTLVPTYVPNWTCVDAIRELFQNALDQEAQNPENKASWEYHDDKHELVIRNAKSKLEAASLLLGQTSKAGDKSTIGQFGEGYKIATLVLLREGKNVVFYNYGNKEIWRPRFVKSRRFGTFILTFFTEKKPVWERVPSADLEIVIEGITPEEYYEEIVPSNLHLRNDYKVLEETEYGSIIDLPGKVFVNGLYVCDYEPYTYGYNFKPEYIRLDRDRKMVNDFDLRWMASKMWSNSKDIDRVLEMVAENKADVVYISSDWCDIAAEKFFSVYGPKAIPVTSQAELEGVPAGYKGIVVSENYSSLIRGSSSFVAPIPDATSPLDDLQEWFDGIKEKLDDKDITKFNTIIEALKNDNCISKRM